MPVRPAAAPGDDAAYRRGRGVRLAFLAVVFLASISAYADRQVIALLKPELDRQFGWSGSDYGLIMAGFQVAVALSLLGVGRFIDHVGLRRGFAIGLGGWSVVAVLHAAATTVGQFLGARVLLGVFESVGTPAGLKAVGSYFRAEERGFALGLVNVAPNLAAVVTPLVVAWLFRQTGWQASVAIVGAGGLVCLLFWLLIPLRRMASAGALAGTGTEVAAPDRTAPDRTPVVRRALPIGIAKFMTDQAWWFMLFWLPDYFHKRYGLDLGQVAGPLAVAYAMAGTGSLVAGAMPGLLRRRLGLAVARRRTMAVCALLALPVACILGVGDLWTATLILGLALAAHQGFATNLFATAADTFPAGQLGRVAGFIAFCGNMGGALILQVAGWIAQAGGTFQPVFIACACAYSLAWVVVHVLAPRAAAPAVPAPPATPTTGASPG